MRHTTRRPFAVFATLALVLALFAPLLPVQVAPVMAQPDGCVVTTSANTGTGSLRDVVLATVCAVITFDVAEVVLATELVIGRNVVIQGPGADLLTIRGSGTDRVFLISPNTTVEIRGLTISGGRDWGVGGPDGVGGMAGGHGGNGRGGGIHNSGILTITGSTLTDNWATGGSGGDGGDASGSIPGGGGGNGGNGQGGGIYNAGTLTITDSTIADNWATGGYGGNGGSSDSSSGGQGGSGGDGYGGGIYSSGNLTILNSTVKDNRTYGGNGGVGGSGGADNPGGNGGTAGNGVGGGIYFAGSSMAVVNSTSINNLIHAGYGGNGGNSEAGSGGNGGNGGSARGGGYHLSSGTVTFTSSTLAANWAFIRPGGSGGSGFPNGADAGNGTRSARGISNAAATVTLTASILESACTGTIGNGGFNLWTDQSCLGVGDGYYPDATSLGLGPLADNGGPTETILPQLLSPAIDFVTECAALTDQRGFDRPQGEHCDAGAVEVRFASISGSDVTVEATGPDGWEVDYAEIDVEASDWDEEDIGFSCTLDEGEPLALGEHDVTCTTEDTNGDYNATTAFTITVADTTAPVLSGMPDDMVVEATSSAGAVVTWTMPTATDLVDGNRPVTCLPASGLTFAIGGPTTVTCSATDLSDNPVSDSFTVTVVDTTAPVMSLPGPIYRTSPSTEGLAVAFDDGSSPTPPVYPDPEEPEEPGEPEEPTEPEEPQEPTVPDTSAFDNVWARTDLPVANGSVNRTWVWGPQPFSTLQELSTERWEDYAESPDGKRLVRYYDKARMEINDPDAPESDWFVTNGLLVVELITGQMQVGDDTFIERTPADVVIAGDLDDPDSPTYADLADLLDPVESRVGETITDRLNDGETSWEVSYAYYDEVTGHNIAAPFWDFMNSSGLVWVDGNLTEDLLFENPFYGTGRPVTEAYWVTVNVGGTPHDVLLQCFERRCLTYTPENDPGWQVEAGNVGLHYFIWRYGDQ